MEAPGIRKPAKAFTLQAFKYGSGRFHPDALSGLALLVGDRR